MSNAPLFDALMDYAGERTLRLHMPGHKGKPLSMEREGFLSFFDFTELKRTGNLYGGEDIISEAEKLCARLYGADACMFMTNGSTGGIQAALGSAASGGKILCDRSAHKCVTAASALYDIETDYILPELSEKCGFVLSFDMGELEKKLKKERYNAFVLTSPTYYGVIHDIKAISAICKAYGTLLITDSAHGAHFPALGIPSAIERGADIAAISMHKTLPALGQSAIVLSSKDRIRDIRRFASLSSTSSPSYAIMASIDKARADLESFPERYVKTACLAHDLREYLTSFTDICIPYMGKSSDPCRLTIDVTGLGITGYEAYSFLEERGVVCEMADTCCVIMILTSSDDDEDLERLRLALVELNGFRGEKKIAPVPFTHLPKRICSPRKALLGERKSVPLGDAEGEIAAESVTVYPPGCVIFAPGEEIDKIGIEILINNGYNISDKIYTQFG
ncbi:MAG: aminotransferase class V-fold PLP-dependent enzyme [Clostridiales bacterium]|nr:aminotransferase class V-fold PLP-dependent enzyme [Clostridiales bacterium]